MREPDPSKDTRRRTIDDRMQRLQHLQRGYDFLRDPENLRDGLLREIAGVVCAQRLLSGLHCPLESVRSRLLPSCEPGGRAVQRVD